MYDAAYYRCNAREEKYICKVDRADDFSQYARGCDGNRWPQTFQM